MKIMWVTFTPIGSASRVFYGRSTQSGGWVDATLKGLLPCIQNKQVSLDIVALDCADAVKIDAHTGVTYRTVQMQRYRGRRGSPADISKWKALIQEIQPDVIQIWGTEFTFGLDILEAAGDIPVCFYIQGIMASLVAHPLGDVSERKLVRQLSPTAVLKLMALRKRRKVDQKHLKYEGQMISRSAGVLGDNLWTEAQYRAFTDKFYTVPLAANPCFLDKTWKADNCQKHTLFTVAGGACPQKGVHNVVQAVALLKEKYPDICLHIPGNVSSRKPHFLYDSIYIRHIRKLISQYKLEEHICFDGSLPQEQMAQHMLQANVFVMPSCVETHSSTLREAMMVGTPCISAMVGSVPEFVTHGENGFLYRYEEPETLAYYIDKLFSDDALAQKIGQAGSRTVRAQFPQDQIGAMLLDAYTKMINR